MTKQSLAGKVALVTGASRGIGKGIAFQLGQAGALVYITGRTLKSSNGRSLEDTANEIRERGGKCIPVQVDHENDSEIAGLFEKIKTEQNGQLDILVNNAYKGVTPIFESSGKKFWETEPKIWDDINNVGLRNHYICTVYASRMMVPKKRGLIVNISSFGGVRYIFNVAYGIGKAAVDRMAQDCGIELRKHGVTMLGLYPGAVKTELITELRHNDDATAGLGGKRQELMKKMFDDGETIEFSGKVIVEMANDSNIQKYSSKVVIAADYAQSHDIKDIDNRVIPSYRQLNYALELGLPSSMKFLAKFVPNFVKIPQFVLDIVNSKF